MLRIHFINVGNGDCTIIEHPSGRISMIDINNSPILDDDSEKEILQEYKISYLEHLLNKVNNTDIFTTKKYDIELTDPLIYFKNNFPNKQIFRFICTHPDMDHISGLHRLFKQEPITVNNFWDSEHTFSKADKDFENTKYDKRDWDTYEEIRKKSDSPKVLWLERHANNQFYNTDGIYILASTKELKKFAEEKQETNHLSYVIMLIYGQTKVILGGDATKEVWEDIVNAFKHEDLKADVLKAPHHGRESGYYEEAVKHINPSLTIVSVGKKPETDASNLYRQYSNNVWSTRWKGNIVLDIDGSGKILYSCQYNR